MDRNKIRKQGLIASGEDNFTYVKPVNYKFNSDNCNCNKGLLPADFNGCSILIKSITNGIVELENNININGKNYRKIKASDHKITCKICNHYIRF